MDAFTPIITVGSKKLAPKSGRALPPQTTFAPFPTASASRSSILCTCCCRISGPISVPASLPGPIRNFCVFSTHRRINSSLTLSSTNSRSTDRHTCPQFEKLPHTAALDATSRSASPSTSIASFPPNSSTLGSKCRAQASATCFPVNTLPVKNTLADLVTIVQGGGEVGQALI